jgi:hypothetical protein
MAPICDAESRFNENTRVEGTMVAKVFAALGAFLLCSSLTAEAQLAKRGTYSSQYGWHTTPAKVHELERDHAVIIFHSDGIHLNDAGQGFLHASAVNCTGFNDRIKGVANSHGVCTVTDREGDKAFLKFKCQTTQTAQLGPRCAGDFQWTGGTGKYVGLSGENTFHSGGVPNSTVGHAVWKGEWRLPD